MVCLAERMESTVYTTFSMFQNILLPPEPIGQLLTILQNIIQLLSPLACFSSTSRFHHVPKMLPQVHFFSPILISQRGRTDDKTCPIAANR